MVSEFTGMSVVVVGSGTMGTALAHTIASNGHRCGLFTPEKDVIEAVNGSQQHPRYFSGLKLHENLFATDSLESVLPMAELVVMALPSQLMRKTARHVGPYVNGYQAILSATKSYEDRTYLPMSEVLSQELRTRHISTLSGPNITLDLVKNLPTSLVVASSSARARNRASLALASSTIRILKSNDIGSIEHVSALKNVVAVTVGIATGLGLGDNFRSVVLVSGMSEISRLLKKMKLQSDSLYDLSGLADIFLTCSSKFAQNYAVGVKMGQGATLKKVLADLESTGETAEGLVAIKAAQFFAEKHKLKAPLLSEAFQFIYRRPSYSYDQQRFLSAVGI